MRLFIRYLLTIIIFSYLLLSLLTHPTGIQRQPDNSNHTYFQSRIGDPLHADEEIIRFHPQEDVIVYNAAWNRRILYTVECVLSDNMALACESMVHYGMARVPSSERYVFHWDQ